MPNREYSSGSSMSARRKARFTYQSPLPGSKLDGISMLVPTVRKRTSSSVPATTTVTRRTSVTLVPVRPRYMLEPPLPLYHPFSQLAKSLPELDAERYGLPVLPRMRDREVKVEEENVKPVGPNGKRSSRFRRQVAKLQEGEQDEESASRGPDEGDGESEEGKGAAVEVKEKEKPSPRKKRSGGGKRKRRDADDGDSAYPAKRTRNPRVVNQHSAEIEEGQGDGVDATGAELEVPERRTTRASASGMKRRDSSVSSETPDMEDERGRVDNEELAAV
jgi:hypothetical protein